MQLFTLCSKSKACESQRLGRLVSGGGKQPYGEVSCLPVRHLATTNRLNFSTLQPWLGCCEATHTPVVVQHVKVPDKIGLKCRHCAHLQLTGIGTME